MSVYAVSVVSNMGIITFVALSAYLLLVSGESKAAILKQALTGPVTTDVPASYLQQQGNVTIIADEAALSLF